MEMTIALAAVITVIGVWTAIVAYGFAMYYIEYVKAKKSCEDRKRNK